MPEVSDSNFATRPDKEPEMIAPEGAYCICCGLSIIRVGVLMLLGEYSRPLSSWDGTRDT